MPELDELSKEMALLDVSAQMYQDHVFGCDFCRRKMLVMPVFMAFELDGDNPAPLWLKAEMLSIRTEFGLHALLAFCPPCRNVHGISVGFD